MEDCSKRLGLRRKSLDQRIPSSSSLAPTASRWKLSVAVTGQTQQMSVDSVWPSTWEQDHVGICKPTHTACAWLCAGSLASEGCIASHQRRWIDREVGGRALLQTSRQPAFVCWESREGRPRRCYNSPVDCGQRPWSVSLPCLMSATFVWDEADGCGNSRSWWHCLRATSSSSRHRWVLQDHGLWKMAWSIHRQLIADP